MTPTVEKLLLSFGSPDLSDDELALAAEDLFLALDQEETALEAQTK